MTKSVIITGVCGQDGSILAELYFDKGWKVFGIRRRHATADLGCLETSYAKDVIELIEGDITDASFVRNTINRVKPNHIFNAAAQSHVGLSFKTPISTGEITGLAVTNILDAIHSCSLESRFLQMSSSEMFGGDIGTDEIYNEESPMNPKSPYAAAKLYAYNMTKIYRDSYRLFACNSICFNHEEPGRRGPDFVSRKISMGVARIRLGLQEKIHLGNLNAERDWGRARDFCLGMISIIEAESPDDYILATGETHSVEEFVQEAFRYIGIDKYMDHISVDKTLFRPNEVKRLRGNTSKIYRELGWSHKTTFKELVHDMIEEDYRLLKDSVSVFR